MKNTKRWNRITLSWAHTDGWNVRIPGRQIHIWITDVTIENTPDRWMIMMGKMTLVHDNTIPMVLKCDLVDRIQAEMRDKGFTTARIFFPEESHLTGFKITYPCVREFTTSVFRFLRGFLSSLWIPVDDLEVQEVMADFTCVSETLYPAPGGQAGWISFPSYLRYHAELPEPRRKKPVVVFPRTSYGFKERTLEG